MLTGRYDRLSDKAHRQNALAENDPEMHNLGHACRRLGFDTRCRTS
jgi:hypothetical protein